MKAPLGPSSKTLTPALLRALSAVAEEGSFAAAARRLGLSHSAVAQQIRDFEAGQKMCLFDRVGGALRPTPICLELCDVAVRIEAAQADGSRILARRDVSGNRRLSVGMGNAMPGIDLLARVIEGHRGVSVTLVTGSYQEVMSRVLRREVDIGILPGVPDDARFRRARLCSQQIVAIVAPEDRLARQGRATLAELAVRPLVFRAAGSSTQRRVDRAFRDAGFGPEPVLVADTRDAVYEAVSAGIGVGFMWCWGTGRTDHVNRIPVSGLEASAEEVVFALADERDPLIDRVLQSAEDYAANVPEQDSS